MVYLLYFKYLLFIFPILVCFLFYFMIFFFFFSTDEGSSRSDSPFIDVERVSSDEEAEKQDGNWEFLCAVFFSHVLMWWDVAVGMYVAL